ncbi:hypothetical protein O3M35_009849 [Rhynocoris fuscipes]|uniref:F-box domain-containing protein n=1 Tax=Rhynocoris fuscipes TaxID=488301 RepID=A0AAW1D9Q5_9HEMI
MDFSKRNGIVFENLIPYMDLTVAVKCSAVCKLWYELINSDELLWKRLIHQQEIVADLWHHQDNEEWIMGIPCVWKQYLMNYKRTAYNLRINKYKQYEFEADTSNFVYGETDNDNIIYNGNTMLIKTLDGINVFRIVNNSIEFVQPLKLTTAKTNTDFIIGLFNESFLFVYKLILDEYKFYCKLNVCSNGDLEISSDSSEDDVVINSNYNEIFDFNIFKTNILLQASPSESASFDDLTFYALDIAKQQIMLNLFNYAYIEQDNYRFYVFSKDGEIIAFNDKCEPIYTIYSEFIKIKDKMIFINYEQLNIWCRDLVTAQIWISSWDKSNGNMLNTAKMLDISVDDISSIVYVKSNVFIIAFHITLRNDFIVKAYDSINHSVLWETVVFENQPLVGNPKLEYKFDNLIINMIIVSESGRTLTRNTVLNVYNQINGEFLYSVNQEISGWLPVNIFHDLIVTFKEDGLTALVNLYR